MTKAEQFFYDQAGFSYDPKTETPDEGKRRCAKEYAEAEAYAADHGWMFTWEPDRDADPFDWDGEGRLGEEAYGCILSTDENPHAASLWGIWDPSMSHYDRVIEAELALEAMRADTEHVLDMEVA